MSNRVEELERQVAQLQAAVNGLTEELVETKERVRQLETAEEEREAGTPGASGGVTGESADGQPGAGPRRTGEATAAGGTDGEAAEPDADGGDGADVDGDADGNGSGSGDILVPTVGEDPKPDGAEGSDGSESGTDDGTETESDADDGSDDIIVA